MKRQKFQIRLTSEERAYLQNYLLYSNSTDKYLRRASILLELDENHNFYISCEIIAGRNNVSVTTILNISRQFKQGGLKRVLTRKTREEPPNPTKFTDEVSEKIISLYYSSPPEGYSKWSLELLAEYTVKVGILESISGNSIRIFLKKLNLSTR